MQFNGNGYNIVDIFVTLSLLGASAAWSVTAVCCGGVEKRDISLYTCSLGPGHFAILLLIFRKVKNQCLLFCLVYFAQQTYSGRAEGKQWEP